MCISYQEEALRVPIGFSELTASPGALLSVSCVRTSVAMGTRDYSCLICEYRLIVVRSSLSLQLKVFVSIPTADTRTMKDSAVLSQIDTQGTVTVLMNCEMVRSCAGGRAVGRCGAVRWSCIDWYRKETRAQIC
jgi:hypothetical protein